MKNIIERVGGAAMLLLAFLGSMLAVDIPAVPTGLSIAARGESSLTLSWMPASDGAGIPGSTGISVGMFISSQA